ncbi:hypothetical protein L210DRAFT_3655078 [Boletus edulis BED1]|uniref:superoxide dismutase n=1 Tax=Boletus edulis BED1 TaxID=1328754 RepID=A0AAD4G7A4_BOLED|nr:hypothetical protein L210DRAFT_3655078 [Boletus edulis BED1]
MAFQAAYFGLYGRTECTYKPAMTKAFLHGRTEAIRTVQPESVEFTKTFLSEAYNQERILALRRACERHVALMKECSQGLRQDRHIYALYCLYQRKLSENLDPLPDDPVPNAATTAQAALPSIFADLGWNLLGTSILSTSNCGNPALRLLGLVPLLRRLTFSPELPYPYDALQPYISEQVMRLHHMKHHQGYVNALDAAETSYVKAATRIALQAVLKSNGGAVFSSTLVALLDSLIEPVVPAPLHTRCLQARDKDEAFEMLNAFPHVNINVGGPPHGRFEY